MSRQEKVKDRKGFPPRVEKDVLSRSAFSPEKVLICPISLVIWMTEYG